MAGKIPLVSFSFAPQRQRGRGEGAKRWEKKYPAEWVGTAVIWTWHVWLCWRMKARRRPLLRLSFAGRSRVGHNGDSRSAHKLIRGGVGLSCPASRRNVARVCFKGQLCSLLDCPNAIEAGSVGGRVCVGGFIAIGIQNVTDVQPFLSV